MIDPDTFMEHCFSSPTPSIIDTSDEMSAEEGGIQWFSKLTQSIKDNIPAVIDGVADTIHRSARTLVNEFAEMENEARRERSESHEIDLTDSGELDVMVLPLPWETYCINTTEGENSSDSVLYQEDEVLKEKVMALSLDETIFVGLFDEDKTDDLEVPFTLDESRVMLIRQLLEIDQNLGHIHAKISGRSEVKETIFWKNYFHHCTKLQVARKKEIEEEHLRKLSYDDELDAELVGHPPASCTGFYSRTGNLQVTELDAELVGRTQTSHKGFYSCPGNLQVPSSDTKGRTVIEIPDDNFVLVNNDSLGC